MKLILVRHGETDRNRDKFLVGHSESTINATGRSQAEAAAQRLKTEHIDVMYVSSMVRAKETAEIIARFHTKVSPVITPDLRERDAGIFANRPIAEREKAQQQSGLRLRDWRPEGGESLSDVKKRATTWFTQIRKKHPADSVLMVGHGLFLYALLEVAVENGADVDRADFMMSNAGISILEVPAEGRAEVIHLNDVSHLVKR